MRYKFLIINLTKLNLNQTSPHKDIITLSLFDTFNFIFEIKELMELNLKVGIVIFYFLKFLLFK